MSNRRRIEFSMSPLYVSDLLMAVEVACKTDPTFSMALKRLNIAIRGSGYTEETLNAAMLEELEEKLGKGYVIIDEDDEEE